MNMNFDSQCSFKWTYKLRMNLWLRPLAAKHLSEEVQKISYFENTVNITKITVRKLEIFKTHCIFWICAFFCEYKIRALHINNSI